MDYCKGMGYGLSQVWVMDIGISYPPTWWIQNTMGYHRVWVITVWVISGLTVLENSECIYFISRMFLNKYQMKKLKIY